MYETRKRIIFEILQKRQVVSIEDLAKILSVSDMTVRRDVKSMAAEGLLRQVHGGAAALATTAEEKLFVSRQVIEQEKKEAIAHLAGSFLKESESLFLDGSTTCAELAQLLKGRRHMVVTDSLSVLYKLSGLNNIELVTLGGLLDKDGNTFDGLLAVEAAKKVHVDCCFFSARGFSVDGISNVGMIGTQVKQIMIKGARRCALLADSTKYRQTGMIRICGWDDVDVLVTDNSLSLEARQAICSQGTEVMVADVPGTSVS